MKQREKFGSRLGFILISAGCAIGLGNVYRFPIITGAYGGAFFVLLYLCFLLIFGLPVMCCELAVGRASQKSIAESFKTLEKPGQKWHYMKYLGIAGNYLLMMFYTCIAGWMLTYFFSYLTGNDILSLTTVDEMRTFYDGVVGNVPLQFGTTFMTIVLCFLVCSLGLQKGVERITKVMMVMLFALIIGLGVYCCTLPGAGEGLKFYLIPSLENMQKAGIWTTVSAAMGQSFFTLSVGIGSIAIFGSYIGRDRSLLGEAATIVSLDTAIALLSGLIVFPACFTYAGGVHADAATVGSSFLFTTLSSIFNAMPAGRVIGSLFFLFMLFAAYSTVIAVFENIMSFWLDQTKLSRPVVAIINVVLLTVLALPTVFSTNIWSDVTVFGKIFLDLEDFTVSNILLPLGSLLYVIFCTSRYGWGWDAFFSEVNAGQGLKFPKWIRPYMTYVLPVLVAIILVVSVI